MVGEHYKEVICIGHNGLCLRHLGYTIVCMFNRKNKNNIFSFKWTVNMQLGLIKENI